MNHSPFWLALVIGNSRWHWGCFKEKRWLGGWHTPWVSADQIQALKSSYFSLETWQNLGVSVPLPPAAANDHVPPELWVASVVSDPLESWQDYAAVQMVETSRVPLLGLYDTFGVDRALTLLGAGHTYGWPVLVIDGGTALTFTAGDNNHLLGGAILPGLSLQFKSLYQSTDQLPLLRPDLGQPDLGQPERVTLPARWAKTTAEAMASGVIYTQLASIRDFITDWQRHLPSGQVIFTGGDGHFLMAALIQQDQNLAQLVSTGLIKADPNLMFWGIRACRTARAIPSL
ncbi:MAG: pantothenate kinase [Leptolyngbyaceae cyanobacterium SM2_3_12]|nr:pantothenate kinase [Leptolyngbyaceae cyanobacterium SM2_3_12]